MTLSTWKGLINHNTLKLLAGMTSVLSRHIFWQTTSWRLDESLPQLCILELFCSKWLLSATSDDYEMLWKFLRQNGKVGLLKKSISQSVTNPLGIMSLNTSCVLSEYLITKLDWQLLKYLHAKHVLWLHRVTHEERVFLKTFFMYSHIQSITAGSVLLLPFSLWWYLIILLFLMCLVFLSLFSPLCLLKALHQFIFIWFDVLWTNLLQILKDHNISQLSHAYLASSFVLFPPLHELKM